MKTARKVLLLVLCAALLVSATVMGTLAYLKDTTETVTNTFTVGNVSFDAESALDEADVDEYGKVESEDRVTENEYKLIPGHTYTKDPTVHMSKTSEDCWLFVKVENGISGIEAAETIAVQMARLGWTEIEDNVYYYKDVVTKGQNVVVFETFTLKDDADVATYANAEITIMAYAIQKDGFDTAAAAWEADPCEWE